MSIAYNRKDNAATYEVLIRQRQLEKLNKIYELLKEKMKDNPAMKVFLKFHSIGQTCFIGNPKFRNVK